MLESFSALGSFVQTPCGPRKSGIPDSVEMPAPVRTTTRDESSTQRPTSWTGSATLASLLQDPLRFIQQPPRIVEPDKFFGRRKRSPGHFPFGLRATARVANQKIGDFDIVFARAEGGDADGLEGLADHAAFFFQLSNRRLGQRLAFFLVTLGKDPVVRFSLRPDQQDFCSV